MGTAHIRYSEKEVFIVDWSAGEAEWGGIIECLVLKQFLKDH